MQLFRDRHHAVDPLWHVQLVLLGVIILQLALPDNLILLPRYVLPALELICIATLQLVTPKRAVFESPLRRLVILTLIAAVLVANVSSLQLVLHALFTAGKNDAPHLLLASANIYITNIVMFALFFWEMDNGGPGLRRRDAADTRDFLFPQQASGARHSWYPTFFDYLYVSVTNGTAFSPTDTLPLSRRAKFLMSIEALVSLLIVVLVTARAVNVL
ncbi:MAG TPA: hypothetical protein VLF40_03320 [Candidatus Saccharimonadales bacterium]|nr:hypothetical protein [Candidatus Saccharimonadales bacterium]